MTKKDYIYLCIIFVGIITSVGMVNNASHKSEWCDTFFEEFRNGLYFEQSSIEMEYFVIKVPLLLL